MFIHLVRHLAAGLLATTALAASLPAHAQPKPYPATFAIQDIPVDGVTLHVRVGGSGPAVVLIHGFGDTGDMWTPLAIELAKAHRVVVPDLRGMGLSSKPEGGYDKRTQAGDIRAVLDRLGIDKADIVGHDIGTMVAYAYAARYPDQTTRLVVMDAPVPGIPPWDQIVRLPALWHFDFGGKDALRLVQGRERIYLDRFWNDFASDPGKVDESTRDYYARIYARPGAMKASFAQFQSIRKDAEDNIESSKTPLTMPVLAIGGEKSFGSNEAAVMRNAATTVTELVVPGAGHWLMEEAPGTVIKAVEDFLNSN
jgi:pimeloyl-ACP methyl ester carboxylesterase